MSNLATLARPYAKAAFALASERQALGRWEAMLALASTIAADKAMAGLLDSPEVSSAQAAKVIAETGGADFDEPFRGFLGVLADYGRLPLLPEITQLYRRLRAEAEKRLAELELENRKMHTTMAGLQEEMSSVEKERQNLDSEHRDVSQELAEIKRTASSALAIDSENKELKSRMVALERSLQTVQQENENLKDRTARDWFMVGAGVVLLGIIVGLIIPRIRWRKKSSWDTF